MATTDLELKPTGALPKPRILGRLLRLAFGAVCLYYVYELWQVRGTLLGHDGHIRPLLWNGILPGLFLVSYVINIGYSKNWKKWSAIVSAVLFVVLGLISWFMFGGFETNFTATALWIWLVYIFGHLGLAFVLASILRTPGCEMRAIHHLWTTISGKPTQEHECPIGPLGPVDRWEARR